ncbi:unnamed protein product, partial [Porites lobata]
LKLVSNANEYLCSSLKSLNMATFALGLRRRTRLSRTQIFHGQAKERLCILNRDIHLTKYTGKTFSSNYPKL